MANRRRSGSGCQGGARRARACSCRGRLERRLAVGRPDTRGVEEQCGVVEGERRLGPFIVVQRIAAEPVAATARREVVERLLQAIAAEEPLECSNRPDSVLGLVCGSEGTQLGFDERGGLERLLVAGARRLLAPSAALVTWEPERVLVQPALVPEPPQRAEANFGDFRPAGRAAAGDECLRQPRIVIAERILEPAPILRAGALVG